MPDCTLESGGVLVVEDHGGVARALRALLEARGIRVDLAHDAAAALARVAERRYDLLVTDRDLGVEDGVELVRRIRSRCPSLPVLLVTAREPEPGAGGASGGDPDEYFQKPVDPRRLLAAVERRLRRG